MNPSLLDIERLRTDAGNRRVGGRIEYVESTTSTNDEVWSRASDVEADGLVVFAEHQTSGRGRLGRNWLAPRASSLLCSILLIDENHVLDASRLVLITAIAVRDAITGTTDVLPLIKWPNDIIVDGRKIAGILIESRRVSDRASAYAIGIGVNCLQQKGHFPPEIADLATSLEIESTEPIDRTALAQELIHQFDTLLAEPSSHDREWLKRQWISRAQPLGVSIRVRHEGREFTGTAIDLDPMAALVVQLDQGGVRAFSASDTSVV